jgi:hypothetical protein
VTWAGGWSRFAIYKGDAHALAGNSGDRPARRFGGAGEGGAAAGGGGVADLGFGRSAGGEPNRSTLQAAGLVDPGWLVEIEATAAKGK